MHIEDFEVLGGESEKKIDAGDSVEGEIDGGDDRVRVSGDDQDVVVWDTKRVLIGAGARVLFYPTLFYNVVRNKFQVEFRWWDQIDQFVLLGAVPFPSDVLELKKLGVRGVVTMNEPYETLVSSSFYKEKGGSVWIQKTGVMRFSGKWWLDMCRWGDKWLIVDMGINHLVLPTRDYLFAPSLNDIRQAVDFIHMNASCGWMTYVHCKAGRGRSTTIVLCYLVQHKKMTPENAYSYVRSIRPRVLLAKCQWQAVKDYYAYIVKNISSSVGTELMIRPSMFPSKDNLFEFDDCSVVVVTKSDLDGYDPSQPSVEGSQILADLNVIYKVRVAGQAALARLSCLWLRCHTQQKIAEEQLLRQGSCTIRADQISGSLTVDIHVY